MATVLDLRDGVDPLHELTSRYLELVARPDREHCPLGAYFIASDSEFAPLARFVERTVFRERFGNDDDTMNSEYDPYEAASYFGVVIDHRAAEPVGASRRIVPNSYGLKTLHDVGRIPEWNVSLEEIRAHHGDVRLERTSDVATIAVRREWASNTGSVASLALFRVMILGALMSNVRHEVFALDLQAGEKTLLAHMHFERLCDLPAIEYLGSGATAPYIGIVEKGMQLYREGDPVARMLLDGEGLGGEVSFPPIDLDTIGDVGSAVDLEPQGERVGTGVNI